MNDWQNIIIEIEYGDTGMDMADENSQYLETYDAMRKTTESEREAKDPITEQINKYARNGERRYQEPSGISKIDPFTDPKDEILSVKMHQTKAIRWNQAKRGDYTAEKFVSNDARKTFVETTQLLENVLEQSSKSSLMYKALKTKPQMRKKMHQVKEGREVQEKLQELSKKEREEGERRIEEFAAKI